MHNNKKVILNIVIVNRLDDNISNVEDNIYTRDLFNENQLFRNK